MHEETPLMLAGGWEPELLGPVAEINQALLEALRAAASDPARVHARALLQALRDEWVRLDQAALERAAACPYLLLDAGLGHGRLLEQALPKVMDAPVGIYLTGAQGVALLRRTLLLGWHLARANRLAARLLLGMSAATTQRLAATRLQELEALAEYGAAFVVPRWEQQPRVWQQLLRAARRGHALQLRAVHLHGLQLLAAGCGAEPGSC